MSNRFFAAYHCTTRKSGVAQRNGAADAKLDLSVLKVIEEKAGTPTITMEELFPEVKQLKQKVNPEPNDIALGILLMISIASLSIKIDVKESCLLYTSPSPRD